METILNLAGALLAGVLMCLWVRYAPRRGASRRTQVAALAMLILILFPVISVTDDLQAAQNPADVAVYLRRGHTPSFPWSPYCLGFLLPACSLAISAWPRHPAFPFPQWTTPH